ncbi:MAG: CoA-binding protein, partial [Rubrimonas sp.]
MTVRNLDRLLTPRSVALVGATDRPGAIGRVVMERLLAGGFAGPVGLVNPGRDAVLGRPCARRIADLPFAPDLGVVTTPPAAAPGVIAQLGAAGARAAVVITAGVDGPSGLRQAMLDAARPFTLRVLGPNCIGLQNPALGLDASFAHLLAGPGDLALLSQSGAIVTAMLDWAAARGVGFSTVASLGDMADVDVGDMLDHLAADRATRAVLVYLEAATQARKFMSAARSCARVKPVIVVKSGRSAAAARAAASHTGAL